MNRHDNALSQGYEPGADPYNSASSFRPIDFSIPRPVFHADEALLSVTLSNAEIFRVVRPRLAAGANAIAQAGFGAHALEQDRRSTALELLREAENLAALGDIDEASPAGWGVWMRDTRSLLAGDPPLSRHVSAFGVCIPGCPACDATVPKAST